MVHCVQSLKQRLCTYSNTPIKIMIGLFISDDACKCQDTGSRSKVRCCFANLSCNVEHVIDLLTYFDML